MIDLSGGNPIHGEMLWRMDAETIKEYLYEARVKRLNESLSLLKSLKKARKR